MRATFHLFSTFKFFRTPYFYDFIETLDLVNKVHTKLMEQFYETESCIKSRNHVIAKW